MTKVIFQWQYPLAPALVRLAFHDCIDCCDGCLNLDEPQNGGLSGTIDSIDAVYQTYANEKDLHLILSQKMR